MKYTSLTAMRMLPVRAKQPIVSLLAAVFAAAVLALLVPAVQAQTLTTLYNFTGGNDGASPWNGLTLDKAGNLYGMTTNGGIYNGFGVVFEMKLTNGNWKETVIHYFNGGGDGCCPFFNTLVFDQKGNLYGTTNDDGPGYGTVFQLTPHSNGRWSEKILYNFGAGSDGFDPVGGVVFDSQGNLYGVTSGGGGLGCAEFSGCGTIYELSPTPNGFWKETVLHRFTGGLDGSGPNALVIDTQGHIYGTAVNGGSGTGAGVAFQLARSGPDWQFQVIYDFDTNSAYPLGPLTLDPQGNLYGTVSAGGLFGYGAVFELIRPPAITGVWKATTLYSFMGGGDGFDPASGVTFDQAGNLYGTTAGGGSAGNLGSVFELKPTQGGWLFVLLHDFQGDTDGDSPYAGVIFGSAGQIYGTTTNVQSGAYWGTVYEITP